jgi:uncharacterized membrane protein
MGSHAAVLERPTRETPTTPAPARTVVPTVMARINAAPVEVAKIGWTLVCLLAGLTGIQAWLGSVTVPGANVASLAVMAVALWGVWRTWAAPDGLGTWGQALILAAIIVGIGYYAVSAWMTQPGYGTDAAAFDQYAASLALHGVNPYTQSMSPGLAQFHVPEVFHTYRLDGSSVDSLSYPAGSFLLYVPALAAGLKIQAANVVDLAFWALSGLLLWRMLPRNCSWAAGIIMTAAVYVSFMIGGLTDALFVPFILIAMYRWDRFGDKAERSVARWIGPVALGIACSIKQTPWFVVPYLVIGIWLEHRAAGTRPLRVVARYCAVTLVTFVVINLPFLVSNPGAWTRGTLLPLVEPTIPDGQGLIDLTIFEHLGGGRLWLYTFAGFAFTVVVVLAFCMRYSALKQAWVPLVAVSFFLPTRSFGSYLFMLVPAAIIAGLTTRPAPSSWRPPRNRWLYPSVLGLGGVTVALAASALVTRAPLAMHIVATQSTGQVGTIDQVTVTIQNRTDHVQRPHFTVEAAGHATTFWNPVDLAGRAVTPQVAAHASTTFTLRAPNTGSMPAVSTPMFVMAFTSGPSAISTSNRYLVSKLSAEITPDAVNSAVPVHTPIDLAVQLQDPYGNPVHRAGVAIVLGQVAYASSGLLAGESSIDGHPEGASPVSQVTDAAGIAHFIVIGDEVQQQPVFYEAWLDDGGSVPHGYSNQVSVQYTYGP